MTGEASPLYDDSVLQRLAERKAQGHTESATRLAAIEAKMTPEWKVVMHGKLAELARQAASPRSKLPRLYGLMEEVGEIRGPHLACNAGCSSCCRDIPVEITDVEARHIAEATGRAPAKLSPGRHKLPPSTSELRRVNGPCTFLVDDRCSIYEHRPYNCRSLGVVDRDALTCTIENTMLTRAKDPRMVPVPMTKMQAFDPLYQELAARSAKIVADIRQFFPPNLGVA